LILFHFIKFVQFNPNSSDSSSVIGSIFEDPVYRVSLICLCVFLTIGVIGLLCHWCDKCKVGDSEKFVYVGEERVPHVRMGDGRLEPTDSDEAVEYMRSEKLKPPKERHKKDVDKTLRKLDVRALRPRQISAMSRV
jgi:hypothetical protein